MSAAGPRHRLRGRHRVTHRRCQAPLVREIDVDQLSGADRDDVLALRDRPAQPRAVHLDDQ